MNRQKTLFMFFAVLALAWTGLLAYLAATVADPVVVSAPQVQLSTLVIAGEVRSLKFGRAEARIVKIFKNELRIQPPDFVSVHWNPVFDIPGQTTYLFALSLDPSSPPGKPVFVVTPLYMKKAQDHPEDARVYPYTDSVRVQTERILGK
jgi:hypothetical protein